MQQFLFWFFAVVAVATAIGVVMARNPLHGALSLIGTFFALACLYVLLGAHMLAALQVLVYAGAVMVLFIFVIMLLNLKDEELGAPRPTVMKVLAGAGLLSGGIALGGAVVRAVSSGAGPTADMAVDSGFGTVAAVGRAIYGPYLLPFEVTSLLLLVSIVAAVVVAKAKI